VIPDWAVEEPDGPQMDGMIERLGFPIAGRVEPRVLLHGEIQVAADERFQQERARPSSSIREGMG
jgi:ABC-type polysaccharide/polyol phosphate transport system ATPase subunit